MAKTKKILILIHNGVEDVEFITPRDVWIRMGLDVDVAFMNEEEYLTTSYGLKLRTDKNSKQFMNNLDDYSALFIPGGPGTSRIDEDPRTDGIIKHFVDRNKDVGAICAAPTLLAKRGYLRDKNAICFDDIRLRKTMIEGGAKVTEPMCQWGQPCEVVIDGMFTTALMYRTALPFAIRFGDKVKRGIKK